MKILVVLFYFSYGALFAQNNGKPFIKLGGTLIVYNGPHFFDVSVAGGIHVSDRFSLQFGVNNEKFLYGNWDVLTLSVSPSYRILKSKYGVSPVIGLDFGTQVWSNGNGRFVEGYYHFTEYYPSYYGHDERYKRGLFFGKVKLLADFKIKSFNIAVGPTFNSMFIKLESVQKYYTFEEGEYYKVLYGYVDVWYGFGAELSLMYTFPMKKRTEKAVSDI